MSLLDGRALAPRAGASTTPPESNPLTDTPPPVVSPNVLAAGMVQPPPSAWQPHHAYDTVHLCPVDIGVDTATISVVAPGLSVKLTVPLNGSNTEALHAMEGLALAPLFAAEHAAAAHPAPFDGTDDGIKRTPRQHNFGFTALGMRRDIDLGAGSENAPVVMTAIHAEISGDKDLSYGMAPIVRPDWMVKLARHGFAPIAVTSDKAWGLPWVEDLATAPKMAANVPYQVLFGIRGNDVFMVGFNADGSLMKHACFGQVTHMRDAEDRVAITQACAALVSSTYPEKKAA